MKDLAIFTTQGHVTLTEPSPALIDDVRRLWPLGLYEKPNPVNLRGLVFRRGADEMPAIKFQQVDFRPDDAIKVDAINRVLIAAATPEYLQGGHRGLLAPLAYMRPKPSGSVETGIAYFVTPELPSESTPSGDTRFDEDFGAGATAMIFGLQGALVKASRRLGLQYQYFLTMEKRLASVLGRLRLQLLLCGGQVLVTDSRLDANDPVWTVLVRAGLVRLPYAPMLVTRTGDRQSDDR